MMAAVQLNGPTDIISPTINREKRISEVILNTLQGGDVQSSLLLQQQQQQQLQNNQQIGTRE